MKTDVSELKVAIVHDFLTTIGGAERVVMALHELFPDAPVYTLRYSESGTAGRFAHWDIRVAPLAKTFIGKRPLLALPFLPNAIDTIPLSEYDIVISSSSAFSKGVVTQPHTLHICYCHTPMRFAWDWTYEYAKERGFDRGWKSVGYRLMTHYLRIWDYLSSSRVDRYVANAKNVAERIKKYYRQSSTVIYPPVDMVAAHMGKSPLDEPYFFIVSRLSGYKKLDLAIEAAAALKQRLVIIGKGEESERLQALAKSLDAPVTFLGYQDDATIHRYYSHCRAFLFPGEDDFGITPVEAMSHGKPVIAYGRGGALETIVSDKTGLFFAEPTATSLQKAMKQFMKQEKNFRTEDCRKQAEKFSKETFKKKMLAYIEAQWQEFTTEQKERAKQWMP